jgi:hypothetical protein
VPIAKNSENKFGKWLPPARLTGRRRGAGDLPSIQRAGGSKTIKRPLPRASSRIPERLFADKKLFLFAKRPLTHPARPTGGRCPIFYYFLLEFMFYKLFKIHTFFKYKIYSLYSFVYIKKFSSILRRRLYLKLV